jgi:hypothetical protein
MTPSSLVKVELRFGGMYLLHLHNRRVRGGKKNEAPNLFLASCWLLGLTGFPLLPEDGRNTILGNVGKLLSGYMVSLPRKHFSS